MLNFTKLFTLISLFFLIITKISQAQSSTEVPKLSLNQDVKKHWYDVISFRGYTQIRYNRFLETNDKLKCEACDRGWGDKTGLIIRRARLIFFGDVTPRLYIYIQGDLSGVAGTTQGVFQMRDAYFDYSLNDIKSLRLRFGMSKVPYGFENMQSSQNRLTIDRSDALNSAAPGERDLGAYFMFAPESKRKLYKSLVADGFKGSGDYGCITFGVYNGQIINKLEANNDVHLLGRISWPFEIKNQILELGVQGYKGKYVVDNISANTKINSDANYLDERVAGSFILYPKPIGLQAEYNIGKGPEYNKLTDSIETKDLEGGYFLISYKINANNMTFIPFYRSMYYKGGKKNELDARSYRVHENEIGVEWQIQKNMELSASYVLSSRRYEDHAKQDNLQKGNLLRLQLQFNY